MKNIFVGLFSLVAILAANVLATETPDSYNIRVIAHGQEVSFSDQRPIIVDGRTLVPIRDVFEVMGFVVDWEDDTSIATLSNRWVDIVIPVGQPNITLITDANTDTHTETVFAPEVPAQIINDRVMLPLRAILESVGYGVAWDESTNTIVIFSAYETAENEIALYIPRELFFHSSDEEFFLDFFQELGGTVAELDDDISSFWRNYPGNAGTVNIGVSFSYSDLTATRLIIEEEILLYLEIIVDAFDSISELQTEHSESYTRFIFVANFEELAGDPWFTDLLDFVLPYISQLEYLRWIFSLYDMDNLEKIVFYVEDSETLELIEIYSFFYDAPLGLSMRHGVYW